MTFGSRVSAIFNARLIAWSKVKVLGVAVVLMCCLSAGVPAAFCFVAGVVLASNPYFRHGWAAGSLYWAVGSLQGSDSPDCRGDIGQGHGIPPVVPAGGLPPAPNGAGFPDQFLDQGLTGDLFGKLFVAPSLVE